MATLIYYNESAYNSAVQGAAWLAGKLTDLVSQYTALALPNAAPLATADLPGMLADPYAWLLGRFLGNAPLLLGGVPVNAQKVFESGIVDKPAGFDAFVNAAREMVTWLANSQEGGYTRDVTAYAVAGNGTVSFSAAAKASQQALAKTYTANAKQDALLADLLTMREVVNRLLGTGALHSADLGAGFLRDAFVSAGAGQVRVNPDYVVKRFTY